MVLSELGFFQNKPTPLRMDNQSAIALARNSGIQGHAKHINIQYHFLQDCIASKKIEVLHCPGNDNPADIFTKPLACPKFEYFCEKLGMLALKGSVN
jgi:hypothetical protein